MSVEGAGVRGCIESAVDSGVGNGTITAGIGARGFGRTAAEESNGMNKGAMETMRACIKRPPWGMK